MHLSPLVVPALPLLLLQLLLELLVVGFLRCQRFRLYAHLMLQLMTHTHTHTHTHRVSTVQRCTLAAGRLQMPDRTRRGTHRCFVHRHVLFLLSLELEQRPLPSLFVATPLLELGIDAMAPPQRLDDER